MDIEPEDVEKEKVEDPSKEPGEYEEYDIYLKVVKQIVGMFVGAGVSHIVYEIVDKNVTEKNKLQKVTTWAGKVAIAMVVKDSVKTHVDKSIDSGFDWCMKNIAPLTKMNKKSSSTSDVEESPEQEVTEPLDD